jgi:hypothetical protein
MVGEEEDPAEHLRLAHQRQTQQLYEARGALAEAVAALTVELGQRRDEIARTIAERDLVLLENEALKTDSQRIRDHITVLQREVELSHARIAAMQNMKVMRWTAGVRRLVYRLRDRPG